MKTSTVSAKLDPKVANKLAQLSKATARSRSFLVAEAIKAYIEDQAWQIKAIEEGIAAADRNEFSSASQVKKTLKKWGVNES
jgi:predicted transcriptional regulator